MAVHDEVLATAQRLCAAKRSRMFSPVEVVRALPHLKECTVRTHIVSRCRVNAPKNHAHKWSYFRRVRRGVYEILKAYSSSVAEVRDAAVRYSADDSALHETIHTVISESKGAYVAECLEVAVVTQGDSLDETLRNLRDAVALFLSDDDPASLGLVARARLSNLQADLMCRDAQMRHAKKASAELDKAEEEKPLAPSKDYGGFRKT